MKRKSAAELFREVSPGLTVIPGGDYPHGPRKKAIKLAEQPKPEFPPYEPHKATEKEWEAAGGVRCPVCGNNTLRLLNYGYRGNRQACPECLGRRRRLLEYKAVVMAHRRTRPPRGGATRARLLMIKYNNKRM